MFKNGAGVNLTHIPYLGGPKAVPALLSGEVQVMAGSVAEWGMHARAGKLNVLAMLAARATRISPDVPMLSEVVKDSDHFTSDLKSESPNRGTGRHAIGGADQAVRGGHGIAR